MHRDIRANFTKAPHAFCTKIVAPVSSAARLVHAVSCSNLQLSGLTSESEEQKVVSTKISTETTSLLSAGDSGGSFSISIGSYNAPPVFQSHMNAATNRLLDVRIQKWVFFSEAWNEIIDHFREEDIISNREMGYLKFSTFRRREGEGVGKCYGFSKPIYLPVFQTAGVVERCISVLENPVVGAGDVGDAVDGPDTTHDTPDTLVFAHILADVTMTTAVSECWELGSYVLRELLGPVHRDDVDHILGAVSSWCNDGVLAERLGVDQLRTTVGGFIGVINTLMVGVKGRKRTSSGRSSSNTVPNGSKNGSLKKALSTNSLSSLRTSLRTTDIGSGGGGGGGDGLDLSDPTQLDDVDHNLDTSTFADSCYDSSIDALRDQVRDKVRAFGHSFKGMLKANDCVGRDGGLVVAKDVKEVGDRLTFLLSLENGFMWDDSYASGRLDAVGENGLFSEVLAKVNGLCAQHSDEVEPKSKEAKRRLTFFVNSLFMDVPGAPSLEDMLSLTVMTPYYSEDVTLSRGELEAKSSALGVSVLLYLQTLYSSDWTNYLERLDISDDESQIFGRRCKQETRRWASLRAQTLERTVSGIMLNEKALYLLARLEGHGNSSSPSNSPGGHGGLGFGSGGGGGSSGSGGSGGVSEDTRDLVVEKFGYVVACQVYGK